MARVNVYLPDELAEQVRAAGLNVSSLAQQALRRELSRLDVDRWLDRIDRASRRPLQHEDVIDALRGAREEFDRANRG